MDCACNKKNLHKWIISSKEMRCPKVCTKVCVYFANVAQHISIQLHEIHWKQRSIPYFWFYAFTKYYIVCVRLRVAEDGETMDGRAYLLFSPIRNRRHAAVQSTQRISFHCNRVFDDMKTKEPMKYCSFSLDIFNKFKWFWSPNGQIAHCRAE